MKPKLSLRQKPSTAPLFQPLEDRRLFSVFFFSFSGGDFVGGDFSLPAQNLSLPTSASSLPQQNLALPAQSLALPIPTSPQISDLNLRGHYSGSATLTGLGSTPLALSITRQRHGSISGTLSFPAFGRSVAGTVPVTFTGNRHFAATLVQDGNSVALTARLNRDGTVTGQFTLTSTSQRISGNVDLARLSA